VVQGGIENNPDHAKLDGKSLPKLNLFGRSTMWNNVVKRQENMEKNQQQCSSTALLTTNEENLLAEDNTTNMKPDRRVGPQQQCAANGISQQGFTRLATPLLEVEQGISSEVEQMASNAEDGKGHTEVSHSQALNQQAQASVPTHADQFNRREVGAQRGGSACDHEEEEFYDADAGSENGLDDGRTLEAPLPSAPSPRTTPAKRRLPPQKLSPGTALNDSKREAAMKEMLDGISQEENHAVPSLPKAPRLHLSSHALSPGERACPEGHTSPKESRSVPIPFNISELAQGGALKSAAKEVTSPPNTSTGANQVVQETSSASRELFGGGDAGFGFNFGADESKDTSFSFFGAAGGCKSPEQEKEGGEAFFLNFGGGDDKMEEGEGGWNFFE